LAHLQILLLHGGVFFLKPYKKGFEKLLGKPLNVNIGTYYCGPEGFLGFSGFSKIQKSMRLSFDNGILL